MHLRSPADWITAGRTALVFVSFYVITLLGIAGCTTMAERAQTAAVADSVTTVGVLALGGTELNPAGLWTIPLKIGALIFASTLPDEERAAFDQLSAPGWFGAAANNVCVAAALIAGIGAGGCVALGVAVAVQQWWASSDEREFYARCSAYRKESGETFRCAYRIEVAETGH